MKSNFLLSVLLIVSSFSIAQTTIKLDSDVWQKFENEQLYVVLESDEDSEFNQAMKDAFAENWTFNEVVFIDSTKYEDLKISGNFFLFQNQVPGKAGKKRFVLNQLELKTINKKGKEILVGKIFQESIDSDYSGEINLVHLPLYIRSIHGLCLKGDEGAQRRSVKEKMKDVARVQTKPLYILDFHYNEQIATLSDLKEHYEYEVHEITLDELTEIIEKKEDAYLFVFNKGVDKSAPVLRNEYGIAQLFSIKTGEMIYYQMAYTSKQLPKGLSKYLCRVWSK